VAVVAAQTVVHVPFPVRAQRKSLEADGLAVGHLTSTGDGSGGNVLHTFRGQAGFLYVVRFISAEMDEDGGVNANPDVELRLDAQWLAAATNITNGDFFGLISMSNAAATGATNRRVPGFQVFNMVDTASALLLGTIQRSGIFDIASMSHRENILTNTYVSFMLFDAYRTEALTVPGILDKLRHGLTR